MLTFSHMPFKFHLSLSVVFFSVLTLLAHAKGEQYFATGPDRFDEPQHQSPTVLIAFLVRNQHTTLPWFLGCLDRLSYPKDRLGLWIGTDHNTDNSTAILGEWLHGVGEEYNSVHVEEGETGRYGDESSPRDWSKQRMSNVIQLRQSALSHGRKIWADYLFFVDSDVYITETNILKILMGQKRTIVAPMLKTTTSYSNFWSGMNSKGFYERTKEYPPIVNREKVGTFPVPMVHTALLINLRHKLSRQVNYYPPVSTILSDPDDIIQLALSARLAGIQMYVCNSLTFGYVMPPPEADETLAEDEERQVYLRLYAMNEDNPIFPSQFVTVSRHEKDYLGYDMVYLINLDRRPDRRRKMVHSFEELRINYKYWPAVDGKKLNDSYLDLHNVKMLDAYLDPYHKRPLKAGEIGCFLSHYFVWKDVIEHGYEKVLVFEDDIRFKIYFREKMRLLALDVKSNGHPDWDLIYIGRKILKENEEFAGSETLVFPSYTYWTLSYALSQEGAKKLLAPDPISKMIPVDEYIPIMYNEHPNEEWKTAYSERNLKALSINPLAVEPTIYYGATDYISDTEDSVIVTPVSPSPEKKQQISSFASSSIRLPDEL